MTPEQIRQWSADALEAPVALTLRQRLVSVEGPDAPVFPPTYASTKPYVIDTLVDGTKVALMDSVGSQANRMEPIFKESPYAGLVPEITIQAGDGRHVSLFDVGHRIADALVRSSRPLGERIEESFEALARGDATPLARLAPTSLVFGVWDSRGGGMKVPRLVSATIRAFDVSELTRSSTYIPALMPEEYAEIGGFKKEDLEKAEGDSKNPLAKAGFVHVPSTDDPGGIIVHGAIHRTVSLNLVALRRIEGEAGERMRDYILGLALVAATYPQDGYLRQGCQLVADGEAQWQAVHRDGRRESLALSHEDALNFAREAARAFGVGEGMEAVFDADLAKKVLKQASSNNKKG